MKPGQGRLGHSCGLADLSCLSMLDGCQDGNVERGTFRCLSWMVFFCLTCSLAWGENTPFRSARQVLSLSSHEAGRGLPVSLEGLVTAYDGRDDSLYLQDLTGGVRVRGVRAVSGVSSFKLRQRVRVLGTTGLSFSPEIRASKVEFLGFGSRLQPMYPEVVELLDAGLECQWIRQWGVVRKARIVGSTIEGEITLRKRHYPFVLLSTNGAPHPEEMNGRTASLLGVCVARTNTLNQMTVMGLLIHDTACFQVNTASFYDKHRHTNTTAVLESMLARPLEIQTNRAVSLTERTMASELMTYGLTLMPARLIGVVQYHMHTNKIFLEDETGVAVAFITGTNRYLPGERIEVVGNPRAGRFVPEIHQAKVRQLGTAPLNPPVEIRGSHQVTENLEGRRIQLSGWIENYEKHRHGGLDYEAIIMKAETGVVNVHMESGADPAAHFPLGSRVRVAGVCVLDSRPQDVARGELSVFVQNTNEISVEIPAPWMKPESVPVFLKTALGFCLLAGAWIIALRHQVRHRTRALALANRDLRQEVEARLKAESEACAALDQERELVKLKSNFVSMVSHEFRTPLGVIQSSSDLLSSYHDRLSPEKRTAQLDTVRRAVRRMNELMEQVLLLARFENPKVRPLRAMSSPVALSRRCVTDVLSATTSRCRIETEARPEEFEFSLDESLFCQALINLLTNAVKYSPPGSVVNLSLRRRADGLEVEVSDTGCGIPEIDRSRLFSGFYRGSNIGSIPGTGLGLVIVKRCVDLMGGQIHLASVEGAGTRVSFNLPEPPVIPSAEFNGMEDPLKTGASEACRVTSGF